MPQGQRNLLVDQSLRSLSLFRSYQQDFSDIARHLCVSVLSLQLSCFKMVVCTELATAVCLHICEH